MHLSRARQPLLSEADDGSGQGEAVVLHGRGGGGFWLPSATAMTTPLTPHHVRTAVGAHADVRPMRIAKTPLRAILAGLVGVGSQQGSRINPVYSYDRSPGGSEVASFARPSLPGQAGFGSRNLSEISPSIGPEALMREPCGI